MKKILNNLFGNKIEKINSLVGLTYTFYRKKGYKKYFVKIDKYYHASEIISCLGFKLV